MDIVQTKQLIKREMAVARVSARRATRAVFLFVAWLAITWLGPEVLPSEGWNIWVSMGALAAYSFLTVVALAAVYNGTRRLVRTGVMRKVVTTYLAPFWMVGTGAICAGLGVWRATADPVVSVWLGVGTALCALSAAYAIARHLEVRELAASLDQIEHSPTELALRTWKAELAARIEAARSVRLPD